MVDRDGFIHSNCVSKWYVRDRSRVPHLLDGISSLTGDKGYDQNSVYKAVLRNNNDANIIIHPRTNAVVSGKKKWTQRNKLSKRQVQKIFEEGIHSWRRESGYYQQSRVENTFFRYKTTLGKKLRSRREDNRHVETVIGCDILNQFLELGRCKSEMVL